MRYNIKFWLNGNDEALFPEINFVGVATAKYTPFGAAREATWQEWLSAVRQGKHRLQPHVVNAIADTPEQTMANIFNAEAEMDYESTGSAHYSACSFFYDG